MGDKDFITYGDIAVEGGKKAIEGAQEGTVQASPAAVKGAAAVLQKSVSVVRCHIYGVSEIFIGWTLDKYIQHNIIGGSIYPVDPAIGDDMKFTRWDNYNIGGVEVFTDAKTVKADLQASLKMKDALVIYFGHSHILVDKGTNLPVEAHLHPVNNLAKEDIPEFKSEPGNFIKQDELTNWINSKNYKASLLVLASCSSFKTFKKIKDKTKAVAAINSGKNVTTHFQYMGQAVAILLDMLTGFQLIKHTPKFDILPAPIGGTPAKLADAVTAANAAFSQKANPIDDRMLVVNGNPDALYF